MKYYLSGSVLLESIIAAVILLLSFALFIHGLEQGNSSGKAKDQFIYTCILESQLRQFESSDTAFSISGYHIEIRKENLDYHGIKLIRAELYSQNGTLIYATERLEYKQ